LENLKRSLGRPTHRWENNIKVELTGTRYKTVDWIHLAESKDQWWALVNTVMKLHVLKKVENLLAS
jgi:predicted small integral membrane protein